jgi:hypothetical protein
MIQDYTCHSNDHYMLHEIRITRARLGPGLYGYKVVVTCLKSFVEVYKCEKPGSYEDIKREAKKIIEKL